MPAPQKQRFKVAIEYRPVSRDERADQRRIQVPVELQSPAPSTVRFSAGGTPIVIFSAGFLQSPASYGTFISQLLAAGLAVVTYDKSFEDLSSLVDDLDSAELLGRIRMAVAARLAGEGAEAGAGPCFLVGHSRGGKLSVLAASAATPPPPPPPPRPLSLASAPLHAADNARTAEPSTNTWEMPPTPMATQQLQQAYPPPWPVSGLILLDPADGAYEPQDPARYPSALLPLRSRAGALAGAPVLVVGAGRGGDCVPRAKNYAAFFEACRGPSALVTLHDAGHLQFLDASDRLAQSICAAGRGLSNSRVAAASGRLAADFIHGVATGQWEGGGGGSGGEAGLPGVAAAGPGRGALERLCRDSLSGAGLRYEVQVAMPGDSEAG